MILFSYANTFAQPRTRPEQWAIPIIDSSLENFYKVSDKLYRSEQPDKKSFQEIVEIGITTVLNLRKHHKDTDDTGVTQLVLNHVKMSARNVSQDDVFQALYRIKQAKGPVVVHCWHGSDRTGTVVAAYRMVFQDWNRADAIDEFKNGGYGFHEKFFSNLITLLNELDVSLLKNKLGLIPKSR